jgi:hypothetical protein
MSDYLLISKGPKGSFTFEKSSVQECVAEAESHLKGGQECTVFVLHSELMFEEVTIKKSAIQLEAEANAAKAAQEVQPEIPAEIKP